MQNLKIMEYQFIFISGSIGAGKSTVIDKLRDIYDNKPFLVKEYIDYDQCGSDKLEKFLKGDITPFEFQKYVVDCAFQQFITFMNDYAKQSNVVIWERHPLESLIFAAQKLTPQELEQLYHYIFNLCTKLGVPLPSECTFVNIKKCPKVNFDNSNIDKICDKIFDFKTANMNLLIHLNVDEQEQTKRLLQRNRDSDRSYLMEKGMEYLRRINVTYSAMPGISYNITPEYFFELYRYDFTPAKPFKFNE